MLEARAAEKFMVERVLHEAIGKLIELDAPMRQPTVLDLVKERTGRR
jgi:hypothetical protein